MSRYGSVWCPAGIRRKSAEHLYPVRTTRRPIACAGSPSSILRRSQEEMTSWELAETSLQEQGGKSYDTLAGQFRWLRIQSHGGPVLDDGRRQGNTMRCQCLVK